MNLEVLRAPVTLGEGKTVTFHRALLPSSTEQHLVDREGGNLYACSLVHNPGDSQFILRLSV